MRYLVTAQEMKQYDKNTIEYLGIPGPVLMERAALAAEDFLKERFDAVKERTKVLILLVWEITEETVWLWRDFLRRTVIRYRYDLWEIRRKPQSNGRASGRPCNIFR